MVSARLAAVAHLLAGAAAWNYNRNGKDWDSLGVCNGLGVHAKQSPIDLPPSGELDHSVLYLKYPTVSSAVTLYNNGHSLAMTMPHGYKAGLGVAEDFGALAGDDASGVISGAKVYRLWQVNFHAPSEHKIAGERYPLEMQMMHRGVDGDQDLAVVVVLFKETGDARNAFLDAVVAKGLPAAPWSEIMINDQVGLPKTSPTTVGNASAETGKVSTDTPKLDFAHVIGDSAYFTYDGSLTIPPCESGVKYFVKQHFVPASAENIEKIAKVLKLVAPPFGNYRTIDPRNPAKDTVKTIDTVDVVTNAGFTFEPVTLPVDATLFAAAKEEGLYLLVENLPLFRVAEAGDSPDLLQSKRLLQAARMDLEAARVGLLAATRDKSMQHSLYKSSPGAVDKISTLWNVIAADTNYDGAVGAADRALAVYRQKSLSAAKVYLAEREAQGLDPPELLTKKAGEPHDPALKLHYHPLLDLPTGKDSNPFAKGASGTSESRVRVGGTVSASAGQPLQGSMKISPNLKQPDGAQGSIPLPHLALPITTPAPTPTTPPPMQLIIKFPLDMATVNQDEFKDDLAGMLAESAGINASRVMVPQIRESTMPMSVLTEDGSLGGALAQTFLRRGKSTRPLRSFTLSSQDAVAAAERAEEEGWTTLPALRRFFF